MKKLLTVFLAILVSVAFVSAALAQAEKAPAKPAPKAEEKPAPKPEEKPAPKPEAKPAKPKVRQFTGEVVKVDAASITVKKKHEEKTFDVTGVKGFKPEDFAAGDKVTVKYTEKEGKLVATSVKKVAAKKPEAKPAPKAEEKPAPKPEEKPAPPAPPKK
ncbi:MAG: hypothetical protein QW212_06540 [Nitrososphaerales archaeon]